MLFAGTPGAQTGAADAGYALAFDGVNDIAVLHPTAQMLGTGWESSKTVSLWVKPTGTPAPCSHPDPATCDAIFGDRARWWGISIGIINGQDRIWVWSADFSPGTFFDLVGIPYAIDQWTHVSLVHGGGVLQAYRNGVLYASTPSGPTTQPPANPVLHLGGIFNGPGNTNWTFQGELDEVSLWNYARTQNEIQASMYQSLVGTEAGLKAYYTMSDGSGISLTDDSQADWTGTLKDGDPVLSVPPNGAPALWVPSGAFEPPEIHTIFIPQITR
jgi:hypothetical protein